MNLLFFGSSARQLFGAYHAPASGGSGRGAVLLCPPWGTEYLLSHRAFRRLASRLSDDGYHVLRFDYYGTGDSAGARDEGDLASWSADASVAADELRDLSGHSTVIVCGLRIGAIVGWRLALARTDVRSIVLWDPVANGVHFVQEIIAAQAELDRWSLPAKERCPSADGTLDVLGFPLTRAMRDSIEAVAPSEFQQRTNASVRVFYSDETPGRERLHAALETAGTPFSQDVIPGQTPWRGTEMDDVGGLPTVAIDRMVEVLR